MYEKAFSNSSQAAAKTETRVFNVVQGRESVRVTGKEAEKAQLSTFNLLAQIQTDIVELLGPDASQLASVLNERADLLMHERNFKVTQALTQQCVEFCQKHTGECS